MRISILCILFSDFSTWCDASNQRTLKSYCLQYFIRPGEQKVHKCLGTKLNLTILAACEIPKFGWCLSAEP